MKTIRRINISLKRSKWEKVDGTIHHNYWTENVFYWKVVQIFHHRIRRVFDNNGNEDLNFFKWGDSKNIPTATFNTFQKVKMCKIFSFKEVPT